MAVAQRRPIRSDQRKSLTQIRSARRQLEQAVRQYGNDIQKEFDGIVSDWSAKNRPRFTLKHQITSNEIVVEVRPAKNKAGKIFGWVDRGTGPYIIRPKRSNKRGRLLFRTNHLPLTLPIARAHVGPGVANGPWRSARVVHHPGIKARKFGETIANRTRPKFRREVENMFRRIARQMNKG